MISDPIYSAYFVSGKITDSKTSEAVAGASVSYLRNDGTRATTSSGADGSYLIYLGQTVDNGYLLAAKDYYVSNFAKCDWAVGQ